MKFAKRLLSMAAVGAVVVAMQPLMSAPAEAAGYMYQTYDAYVAGKKCRFGNSGCYNIIRYKWVWHTAPTTTGATAAASRVASTASSSTADSAGNVLTCPASGCAVSGISRQVKTAVPTLDVQTAYTVTKINAYAPTLPYR